MKTPELGKHTEVLWALMVWAVQKSDRFGDERDWFMCYMKDVTYPKSKRYYTAIKELTDLNMIVRYKNSPSIFIINPEYIPRIGQRKIDAIKSEMSMVDLSFIQQERHQS